MHRSTKQKRLQLTRKADLDLRQRACRKAAQLLNQYFVFVGKHESRHVASSLLLTYVFSLESTAMTSGGGGGGGGPGEENEMGEMPAALETKNTRKAYVPPHMAYSIPPPPYLPPGTTLKAR